MKYYRCENCGSELTKNADNTYTCGYCRRTYYDDSLEKAYDRVYKNLRDTVRGVVTEELLKQKIEQIANCRQRLYKARTGTYVDRGEIDKWSGEILKLSPEDAQANFYSIASKKRWSELNKYMQRLDAREISYHVEGFVDYLTKDGGFADKCVLSLSDLIDRAFSNTSNEYAACHKKIVAADERERSGIFDVELPRDVFVAYSSKDKEQVYELVEYLEKNGFSCFVAMRNLAKGVDAELKYNERLKKAIDNCRVFLLVSSSNSRARDCDAYKIEMKYVRESDCKRAKDPAVANARYEEYLEKNRKRCKPRLEYVIEEYGSSPYEKLVKQFFGGLTWCTSLKSVSNAVFELVESAELEETEEEKFARERAELEAQKAEMEKAKLEAEVELAKKQAEIEKLKKKKQAAPKAVEQATPAPAPTANIDDLYKAFKERERAEEEERKRKAEEAARLERERRRAEELSKLGFTLENGVLKKYAGTETSLVLPEEVIAVADDAFLTCSKIKLLSLPKTLSKIGDRALIGLTALSEIRVAAENESYESANGVLYTKGGMRLLCYPAARAGREFTLPEKVTEIAPYAFSDCPNLYSVTLSKSVTKIGDSAFEKCSNVDVKNLSFVKAMGSNVFKRTVNIPLSVNLAKAPSGWVEDWNCGREVVWERSPEVLEKKRKEAELARIEKERKAEEAKIKRDFVIEKNYLWCVLKQYKGKDENVVIPEFFSDYDTVIAEGAFKDNHRIKTVTFPSNISEIGKNAFSGCINLREARFDERTKEESFSIKEYAFKGCCKLTSVEFAEKMRVSISNYAFKDCGNLMRVALPQKVSFGSDYSPSFENCYKLAEIYNKSELELSCGSHENGGIALRAKNIYTPTSGESKLLTDENGYALYVDGNEIILVGYLGEEAELVLPDGITEINSYAFYHCKNLTSVQIPSSVKKIGYYAFAGCELQKVDYKGSLEDWFKIEFDTLASPFQNTQFHIGGKLVSKLQIPPSVTEIGEAAFRRCASIKSIEIPESVTSIGGQAFAFCENLTTVKISSSVTSIGDEAFMNCKKAKIYVDSFSRPSGWMESWSKGVKAVEWKKTEAQIAEGKEKALLKQGFEVKEGKLVKYVGKGGDVVIPDSVTSIGNWAFASCKSLTSVVIPDSVTSLGDRAFYNCTSLTSVEIPDSVTSIGGDAFYDCKSLTSVEIPDSVASIGNSAFYGCTNLTSVYITDIAAWCNIDFGSSSANPLSNGANLYLNNELVTEFVIPDTVTEIKAYAFYGCESLTSVVIPNSVTSIGESAFYNCSALTSVVIPDSVTSIGGSAFSHCGALTSVVIPDSVTSIDSFAFFFCASLTSVVIGDSVTSIGGNAFYGCKSLKKIFIPKSVENIGKDAFGGCGNSTIYAEAKKKPKGWYWVLLGKTKGSWNPYKRPVVWGATKADFDKS